MTNPAPKRGRPFGKIVKRRSTYEIPETLASRFDAYALRRETSKMELIRRAIECMLTDEPIERTENK